MATTDKDGTWENEGEDWQGGSFNPDGSLRSEDWKRGEEKRPPSTPPAPPRTPNYVHPDTPKHAAGWQAFRERGLALPLAYHTPIKNWTHFPAPTPAAHFPSLDAWLAAERKGKLTDVPMYEPYAFMVTDAAWNLGIIPKAEVQTLSNRLAEWRWKRPPWPRACCKCDTEFRPKDGRQQNAKRVRCEACRRKGGSR